MSQKSDSSYNSSGCSTSERKKLKPYDYEPLPSFSDKSDSELETDCQVPDDSCKGKKSSCKCAQCKALQTERESWCSRKLSK